MRSSGGYGLPQRARWDKHATREKKRRLGPAGANVGGNGPTRVAKGVTNLQTILRTKVSYLAIYIFARLTADAMWQAENAASAAGKLAAPNCHAAA